MKNTPNYIKVNQQKASPLPLGTLIHADGIHFAVSMPRNEEMKLLLYPKQKGDEMIEIPVPKENRQGRIAYLFLDNLNPEEWEYNYACGETIFQDPYAKKIVGKELWGKEPGEIRCAFLTDDFDWEGDSHPNIPYEDTVIYRMHVRGFTRHSSSGVQHKGTFAGIIEKIPYLKELGITLIELMPAYEFDEILRAGYHAYVNVNKKEEGHAPVNYWGYADAFYFAPKASYASSVSKKNGQDASFELKQLVKILHQHGIELGMEFYFAPGTPAGMIMDCLRYWVLEYHVDEVHVNADAAPMNMIGQDALLSSIKLLGNTWDTYEIYGKQGLFGEKNLAECNDGFMVDARRLLKSDENQMQAFLYRISRNPDEMGVINYIANHDSLTLADMVSYERKHNEANGEGNKDGNPFNFTWNCGAEGESRRKKILDRRRQQIKNALIMVLLSQGTPMLLAGDEMGRTGKGNNNPYCQDNEISWLNWKLNRKNQEIYEFVKALLAFRKSHRILHMKHQLRMMDYGSVSCPDLSYHSSKAWYPQVDTYSRYIGVMYCGFYAKYCGEREDDNIYIAYNTHWEEHKFALPNLPKGKKRWRLAIHTACNMAPFVFEKEEELSDQKGILVPPRAIAVLVGR